MNITVTDKKNVEVMARNIKPDLWIIILDPRERMFIPDDLLSTNRVRFSFEDVLSIRDFNIPPTFADVNKIIKLARNCKENSKVLVNCHAGVSRSTACSIIMQVATGTSIDDAIELVESQRKFVMPNTLMTMFADKVLELDGELHRKCEEVAQKHLFNRIN
jgi:predicted protein tyrosine phosphatase